MATTTPNYSFQKPTESGDSGVWGGYLNANWASIDSLLGGDTVVTGIDINSGTIDGATIGANSATSGAFTTLSASGTFTLGGVAITASGAEINYLTGVTSNIQTQLDATSPLASPTFTGTVTMDGLTASASTANYIASITNSNGTDAGGGLFVSTRWNTSANPVAKFVSNSGSNVVANFAGNGDLSLYDSTGTTPKFFWDASAEALGIGTASPTTKFQISQDSVGAYVGASIVNTNAGGYSNLTLTAGSGTGGIYYAPSIFFAIGPVAGDTNTPIVFRNNNATERMRIDSSGNVGIGNTAPQYQLDLNTTGSNTLFGSGISASGSPLNLNLSSWGNSGGRSGIITFTTGSTTNGSERMRIDAAGNVGIGDSSPASYNALGSARNVVVGSSGGSTVTITSGATSYGHFAFATGTATDSDEYRGLIQYYHGDNSMRLYTNASEKLRIDASGNVGIGVTSPTEKIDVSGTVKATAFEGDGSGLTGVGGATLLFDNGLFGGI